MRSHFTATSFAALSLVKHTSAASSNATATQLSASDHQEYDPLGVFGRGRAPAGGVGSNIPKVNGSPATATKLSTSTTTRAASTKTETKTKTNAPEATQSPDPDKTAAGLYFDWTHTGNQTVCNQKLRDEGRNLIVNADSVDYPDWPRQLGASMRQCANVTACPGEPWAEDDSQKASLNGTAERLEAGNVTTIA